MSDLIVLKRPPKPARETARYRQGMSVRVDAGLLKAFHEARKKHGFKVSEFMELILWNTLGEPRMSFEAGFYDQQPEKRPASHSKK